MRETDLKVVRKNIKPMEFQRVARTRMSIQTGQTSTAHIAVGSSTVSSHYSAKCGALLNWPLFIQADDLDKAESEWAANTDLGLVLCSRCGTRDDFAAAFRSDSMFRRKIADEAQAEEAERQNKMEAERQNKMAALEAAIGGMGWSYLSKPGTEVAIYWAAGKPMARITLTDGQIVSLFAGDLKAREE